MKTYIILIILLLLKTEQLSAQDVLVLRSGQKLRVNLIQISDIEIKYTHFDSTQVGVQTISKQLIAIITHRGGTTEIINAKSDNIADIEAQLQNQRLVLNYRKYEEKYRKQKLTGIIFTSVGGAMLVTGIPLIGVGRAYEANGLENKNGNDISVDVLYAGVLLSGFGFTMCLPAAMALVTLPISKRRMDGAKALISFAPSSQPLLPVGNISGNINGLAMNITF